MKNTAYYVIYVRSQTIENYQNVSRWTEYGILVVSLWNADFKTIWTHVDSV